MSRSYDVAVIGGGIAGVSAAAALADDLSVVVLEQEPVLAFHSSGRSAATFYENYGAKTLRSLTRASRPFFFSPPEEVEADLIFPRGVLTVARADQVDALEELAAEAADAMGPASIVPPAEAVARCPVLDPEYLSAALWEPESWDIDVATLHQGFVRLARAHGATIVREAEAVGLERRTDGWHVTVGSGDEFVAEAVVNAAGAWGDVVAVRAGVAPLGLTPLRRTAFMVAGHDDHADLPFVVGAEHEFYFRPDGSQFLCSPAEEEPTEPGDPRPREEDVAAAIDRINAATSLGITHVRSQWTGLRTFTPDRGMAIGEAPGHRGFFWLVGQGGSGIMTSPGAAQVVASLVRDEALAPELVTAGVDPDELDPARFR